MKKYTDELINQARNVPITAILDKMGEGYKTEGKWRVWIFNGEPIAIDGNHYYNRYTKKKGDSIQFLLDYFQMEFKTAISYLLNETSFSLNAYSQIETPFPKKDFSLPKKRNNSFCAENYLVYTRHIDKTVVNVFLKKGLIYENEYNNFHNVVFVGKDPSGRPRHAHVRGTRKTTYRRDQAGSDKRFSFNWVGTNEVVYLFEAPIDLLSYISLHPDRWQENSYVAACGVSDDAILQFLTDHSKISKVFLCFDNDSSGKTANESIKKTLEDKEYKVTILVPDHKDWNEDLCHLRSHRN